MDLIYIPLLVLAFLGILIYFYSSKKRKKKYKIEENSLLMATVKKRINDFIEEIKKDYSSNFKYNFLAIRFDIESYNVDGSYILSTEYISGVDELFDSLDEIRLGENYINELLLNKYNLKINSAHDQIIAIVDLSRVEGELEAIIQAEQYLTPNDFQKQFNYLNTKKKKILDRLG